MRCLDLTLLRKGKFHVYCLDSHELFTHQIVVLIFFKLTILFIHTLPIQERTKPELRLTISVLRH